MRLPALLLLTGLALPASADQRAAFKSRLASRDLTYHHGAVDGAAVTLLAAPRAYAAGVAVPASVANAYKRDIGGANDKPDELSHHQSGHDGNGEEKGEKVGHWDDGDGGADAPGPAPGGDQNQPPAQTVDNELVRNAEFSQGLAHWESASAYTTSAFGSIRASELSQDGIFAVAHTGFGDPNNLGFVQQNVTVPMARNAGFSMLYNFVTMEFPTWLGTNFNDSFSVTITGPSGEKTFSAGEFLNTADLKLVNGLPSDIIQNWFGDPDGQGGATGWKVMNQTQLALKSGIYKVRIEVRDVGDNIVDSAILVDRVSLK